MNLAEWLLLIAAGVHFAYYYVALPVVDKARGRTSEPLPPVSFAGAGDAIPWALAALAALSIGLAAGVYLMTHGLIIWGIVVCYSGVVVGQPLNRVCTDLLYGWRR